MRTALILSALLLTAGPAAARVVEAQPDAIEVSNSTAIAAPPDKVWAALTQPKLWWDSAHTWSQSAANLSLDARAGGCLCEALPGGGSVLHQTVIFADPGKTLRLRGPLGPLQGMAVDGPLTWSIKAEGSGSVLTQTYAISGHNPGGLDKLAPIVDGVLGQQLMRLKRYVETGAPAGG